MLVPGTCLPQGSYCFLRQQVRATGYSQGPIGYGPSARDSRKEHLAVWTQDLLCQLTSESETSHGHSLFNNKDTCYYVAHYVSLRDLDTSS